MATSSLASALQRVRSVFERHPAAALHADAPARARWDGGLRVVTHHATGATVATDMPKELGGLEGAITPGWLLRAALASCLATRIAWEAADRQIAIASLEVTATSESDARGIFGMTDGAGERITPAPRAVALRVRLSAPNVPAESLRAMIEESGRCSPVQVAVEQSVPIHLQIEIEPI